MYSIHEPAHKGNEEYEENGFLDDLPYDPEKLPHGKRSMLNLKKLTTGGSCVVGFFALSFISSVDHGINPWFESPFAKESEIRAITGKISALEPDVAEVYSLFLARAIRDSWADRCLSKEPATRANWDDQLERLQSSYIKKNGVRYLLPPCKDL